MPKQDFITAALNSDIKSPGYWVAKWLLVIPFMSIYVLLFTILVVPPLVVFRWIQGKRLPRRAKREWGENGKSLILVYSNSPNWQSYVESHWLPHIGNQAIIMNWSLRKDWKNLYSPLERNIFRFSTGVDPGGMSFSDFVLGRDPVNFNPLAIVLTKSSKFEVIRFFEAFRDYKHGNEAALKKAEARMFQLCGKQPPA